MTVAAPCALAGVDGDSATGVLSSGSPPGWPGSAGFGGAELGIAIGAAAFVSASCCAGSAAVSTCVASLPVGAFAASFAKFSEYHANIGAPGRVDAGAGQRYVTVPVQVYARRKTGAPAYWRGQVVLHRTADIDGATAEDKAWRIKSIDLKPAPSGAAAATNSGRS